MGSLAVVVPFSAPPDPQAAQRMLAAAPHRGTDLDVRVCGNAVLGVSSTPGRPDAWIASRNGLTAALAGSLDNAAELREELRRAGVDLSEDDPASTLAAAFGAWGERTAERLRGPFTAAVSDGSKVWCVRDQLGLRPLFYRQDEHAFVAATEPKQVVAGTGASREPDLEAVESMFYGQFDMRKTMLKGVDRFPRATLMGGDRAFEEVVARVVAFVEAPALGLDLPLDVRGTAFQQRVWQALRKIPVGSTITYAELAARIGAPKAVRGVAGACAANPLAVAIPCHRVIRNDGAVSGYRWGVERKRMLLEKEVEFRQVIGHT